MYKNKKTGIVGSIITVLVLIILVFTSNISVNSFANIENIFNKLVMPLQNGMVHLKNKISKNNSYFETVDSLKDEIESLTKQNKELNDKLEELQIMRAENNILRESSKLGEQYSQYEFVTAYIINKNMSNFNDTFVINVGTDNGVYANMAVMGKDGLIGHTISATKNTAKVQPIIDSSSNISAITQSSRSNVIVKGQLDVENKLIVTPVQPDTELFEGDLVETSGIGGIYPKGIIIGTIKEIIGTKNATEKYAILDTALDLEHLEYVLVIKK